MTRYNICHELQDGTLTPPFKLYSAKRMAVKIAQAVAKTPVADAQNVVVMDSRENVSIAVFPVESAS